MIANRLDQITRPLVYMLWAIFILINRQFIKKRYQNYRHILSCKNTSKWARQSCVDFSSIEIASKKYVKTTWNFRSSKLHQIKYIGMTSIFHTSKLHKTNHVETTWIFYPSKLHQKSLLRWSGYSSIFSFWCIDIILTSTRCRLDELCPLDINVTCFAVRLWIFKWI